MGYIEHFFEMKPEEVTYREVQKFIKKKKEESSNLEYKDERKLKNLEELSEDVSAFANSDGGLMILGVSEEKVGKNRAKIYPKEITWSNGSISREALDQSFNERIDPPVKGLKIIPIRKNERSSEVIFLIDIPKSKDAPHTVYPSSFYKRLNFGKRRMKREEIFSQMKERLSYEKCALFRNWLKSHLGWFIENIVVYSNPQHIEVTQTNLNELFEEFVEKSPDEIVEMIKEGHCNIWNIDDRFYQLKYYLDGVKRYPHNEITPEESILLQEIEETIPSNRGLSKWLSNKMGFLDMERAAMDNEFLRILKTYIRPMLETSKLVLKLKTKLDEMEERYGSFFDYISHVSNDKEIKNGKP